MRAGYHATWEGEAVILIADVVQGMEYVGVWVRRIVAGRVAPIAYLRADLAHAGTRAAYDRDLALALGAPVYLVDRGVGVSVSDDEHIIVRAGFYDNPNSDWHQVAYVGTLDPLLARALAWPADKRVTG